MTQLLAVVGATASGKTGVATALAPSFGAEVVSCDSMTVYRGMDIGTAKPDRRTRARVPHHLLDLVEPSHAFTVAEFQARARGVLADLAARGRRAIVTGGSGLYFRAALDPLRFPPTDAALRADLMREDIEDLYLRLKHADPVAAESVDMRNKRRVVRALEVIALTGRPFSEFREDWETYRPALVAGLSVPAGDLDRRIEERFGRMLEEGLLDEVRSLVEQGYRDALTASQAIGYGPAVAYLEGLITRTEMVEEATRATRRLARRQMRWFRRDPRVRWFDASDIDAATEAVRAYWLAGGEGN